MRTRCCSSRPRDTGKDEFPMPPKSNPPICTIDGCTRGGKIRVGLCDSHYARLKRSGSTGTATIGRPRPICSVGDCSRFVSGHGYCDMHRRRWLKYGDPLVRQILRFEAPETRFWQKVDKSGPVSAYAPQLGNCWLWNGAAYEGYGSFYFGKSDGAGLAHHFLVGRPPKGMEWDHLCYTTLCVRPEHLEMVTGEENLRRREAYWEWKKRRAEA